MDFVYGRHYRDLYNTHWWWRAREAAILDVLRRRKPPGGWKNILDIGCGDGLFFDQLLQFGDVDGVEFSADLISADGPHRSRIRICPFDENFRPGKRYSLILLLDVLEHLPDPAGTLRYALSLLAEDGAILITVPAFKLLWTNQDVISHHLTRYTKMTLNAVAKDAGMKIEDERYWFQWAFPAKLVQRIVERILHSRPSYPGVPPRPINRAFYLLSRAELALAGRVSFPFGSSLFVLGHRAR